MMTVIKAKTKKADGLKRLTTIKQCDQPTKAVNRRAPADGTENWTVTKLTGLGKNKAENPTGNP